MKSFLILFILLSFSLGHAEVLKPLEAPTPPPLSVYQISPWFDGGIILGASLATLYGYTQVDYLVKRRCPCDPSEVNNFDKVALSNNSSLSFFAANLALSSALLLPPLLDYYDVGATSALAEDIAIYAEVLSVTQALATFTKITTQRPFPQHYLMSKSEAAQAEGGGAFLSFFSAHTASAVGALSAASMTYGYRHTQSIWPWIVTGSVGTFIAVELVAAGEHYPSDVLIGGLVGSAIGILIPYFHHKAKFELSFVVPSKNNDQVDIFLTKHFL